MKKIILSILFLAIFGHIYGQGCSDSGFCSMGAIRPNQTFVRNTGFKLRSFEVNYHYGRTKFADNIWAATLEGNFSIGTKTMLQFRLPYLRISGALGSLQGIGDISLSVSQSVRISEKQRIALMIGTRLPSNDGNRISPDHNIPLPTYYQTSLGTFDAIAGISWMDKNWLIATGIQHPLGKNKNNFLWGVWDQTELGQAARAYPIAKEIYRGTDVMLRIEHKFRLQRWTMHLGVLGIYRLNKDEILVPETKLISKVNGTDGLASNAVLGLSYSLNKHNHLKLLIGKKINERAVTLDGLQREIIAQVNYEWRF